MKRLMICALACALLIVYAPRARALIINEIISSNAGTLVCADGSTPDWVELYNDSADAVDLSGVRLSDDARKPDAFAFPEGAVLGAGEYAIVYCDGRLSSDNGEWHAKFKLDAQGEELLMFVNGALAQSVAFPALAADTAFARAADGAWRVSLLPTPGEANVIVAENEIAGARGSVWLSEVMASSAPYADGAGHDWVEVYNATSKTVSLKGYSLSTALRGGASFAFPDVQIKAGKYLVVQCTADPVGKKEIASGFTLSAKGGTLVLRDADGELSDMLTFGAQYGNVSYGRVAGGEEFAYLERSTPGTANAKAGYATRAKAPVIDTRGGFFTDAVTVSITAAAGCDIRYTLNGDIPDAQSALYTAPLTLADTTMLRAVALSDSALASEAVSECYLFFDAPGVPVVSLMVDEAHFNDRKTGAYKNHAEYWEYPAQVAYFDASGACALNMPCGWRIAGDASRVFMQKGIALFARKAYGVEEFAFDPFPNRDFASYQSFTLRSCGTEGTKNGLRFRDAFATNLAISANCLVSDCQPVLLYINGQLWGQYNLRERINKHAIAQHEGVTDEDDIDNIDILVGSGKIVNNGSNEDYFALSAFMKNNDLNAPENMEHVLALMDVDSYFDYVAYMFVTGSRDVTNARFYRVPGGKWKWTLYDLDTAMETVGTGIMPMQRFMRSKTAKVENELDHVPFAALMEVPAMREKFLARLGEILADTFTRDALKEHLDTWTDWYAPFIPYQCERWPLTMNAWKTTVSNVRKVLIERPLVVEEAVCRWFSVTKDEEEAFFGAFLRAN